MKPMIAIMMAGPINASISSLVKTIDKKTPNIIRLLPKNITKDLLDRRRCGVGVGVVVVVEEMLELLLREPK